jgi:hypothetical protein
MAMRENTAKLKPAPSALHLMASGVVDQIRMAFTNASGSYIIFSSAQRTTGSPTSLEVERPKNKKATEFVCGLEKAANTVSA